MPYTITTNPAFNSLEIAFDGKPSEAIRQALKDLKFRWHGVKKVWYGYGEEAEIRAACRAYCERVPDYAKLPQAEQTRIFTALLEIAGIATCNR